MDILPPDLVTYSNDAKTPLEDLQSRNERMFLLTFLVVNIAPTPSGAGQRPVHAVAYRSEIQLHLEAAGLPAGGRFSFPPAARP